MRPVTSPGFAGVARFTHARRKQMSKPGADHEAPRESMNVLTGVKVVELGGMGPGPFAGMMLADHGAEVTVLKRPDYVRRMYEGRTIFDRGKQAEVVDLKSDAGRARALELLAGADVSTEGFRPGTAERLRLGPGDCPAAHTPLGCAPIA